MNPFKLIKKILPQSFFGRALMIVITPVVLIQVLSGYVFFDRHWDYVTRVLARNIAGDVGVVVTLLEKTQTPEGIQEVRHLAQDKMFLQINLISAEWDKLPHFQGIFHSFLKKALSEILKDRRYTLSFDTDWIHIWVQTSHGILYIKTWKKRLFSRTTSLFLVWSLGSSLIFVFLAALFMRNQIRPLRRLSYLAEQLGRGRSPEEYKPGGAFEIRKVGIAFRIMNLRLQRQVQERTEMLAGISHDLRTSLTRMKLQLALMPPSSDVMDLQEDVTHMIHMVEGYLDFSRGEEAELPQKINLLACLHQVTKALDLKNLILQLTISPKITITARPQAMHRCLTNILENALRYAQHEISISASQEAQKTVMRIDDDGPGIPPAYYDDVLKPFFRVDASRNPKTGGLGLGLSIVRSLMKTQEGTIHLSQSPQKGLRVTLELPS